MTKKDYALIAGVLRQTKASERTVLVMAMAFCAGNPNFDHAKFRAAARD